MDLQGPPGPSHPPGVPHAPGLRTPAGPCRERAVTDGQTRRARQAFGPTFQSTEALRSAVWSGLGASEARPVPIQRLQALAPHPAPPEGPERRFRTPFCFPQHRAGQADCHRILSFPNLPSPPQATPAPSAPTSRSPHRARLLIERPSRLSLPSRHHLAHGHGRALHSAPGAPATPTRPPGCQPRLRRPPAHTPGRATPSLPARARVCPAHRPGAPAHSAPPRPRAAGTCLERWRLPAARRPVGGRVGEPRGWGEPRGGAEAGGEQE